LITQEPAIHEVFVFANDDSLLCMGTLPNNWVIHRMEAQIEDVRRLMALADNPSRERGRELRINEKVHIGCNTA
jgi:hypothetical protein